VGTVNQLYFPLMANPFLKLVKMFLTRLYLDPHPAKETFLNFYSHGRNQIHLTYNGFIKIFDFKVSSEEILFVSPCCAKAIVVMNKRLISISINLFIDKN
jgi:hypothetical protein